MIAAQGIAQIALIFGDVVGAIFFRTLFAIISRWFYAQKDTKTPLLVSLFVIGLNIYLAYTLSQPEAYGIAGLAMAQSIVAAIEVVILSVIMFIRDRKLFDGEFWNGILRILSVTGFSVLTAFIMISLLPLNADDKGILTLGSKLGVIAIATLTVHVGVSLIFDLNEAKPVIRKVKQLITKPIRLFR